MFCAAVRFRYRAGFVTHCMAFVFLCLWLPAETAVAQDLCLVEGNTKIEICRGKWGFFLHIFLDKLALDWCNIEMPNNATLAWWLIMRTSRKHCRRRVELAAEAGDVFFFFFDVLCFFYLAPSLTFLIHVTRNKEKTHCGLIKYTQLFLSQTHELSLSMWKTCSCRTRLFSPGGQLLQGPAFLLWCSSQHKNQDYQHLCSSDL